MAVPLVLATALTAMTAADGPAPPARHPRDEQPAGVPRLPTGDVPGVPELYLRDCGSCHGARGEGTMQGPRIAGAGDALVDYELSTGRMPIAPGQASDRRPSRYDEPTRRALVAHVATFVPGGPPIPAVDPDHADLGKGGELYRLNCAACHTTTGAGGALLDQNAPPVTPATDIETAEAIRAGPGTMPIFGPAALTDEEMNDVVAYVRYLKDPVDRGGLALGGLGPLPEGAAGWIAGFGALALVCFAIERRVRR